MSPDRPGSDRTRPFRIGEWLVQPELNRIEGRGRTIQIEPRVMDVLVHLAARPGRVVSRRDLHGAVWSDAVVCEQTLTRAVWELRNALGDDPANPRVIETIRKGGYRLIAPVAYADGAAREAPGDESALLAQDAPGRRRGRVLLRAPAIAGVILAAACGLVWLYVSHRGRPAGTLILEGVPLTSLPGRERYPAMSPDGTRAAFCWKAGEEGSYDIYVKLLDGESRLQLTNSPEDDLYPVWSPDGSTVAFVRGAAANALYTVPSIGGEAVKLADVGHWVHGIDWSPDGRWIAYSCYRDPRTPSGIKLISPATRETRELTPPPEPSVRYLWPRFSPDGSSVAFLRVSSPAQQDVYLVAATGGEPRRLTRMSCPMAGMDWSEGGDQLILSASQGQDHLLWRVSAGDGRHAALPTRVTPAVYPSLSRQGHRLVYETPSVDRDIWRVAIGGGEPESAVAEPLICSTRTDCCAEYSPDGSLILFLSTRSGHKEVWISDRDGRNPRRLTSLESLSLGQPRWSPDGKSVAFSAFQGDFGRAFVMPAQGGAVRCLSTAPRHEIVTGWSRNGDWIYVQCSSDSGWHAEKLRRDGTESRPTGIRHGHPVFESREGDLYFFKYGDHGIWRMDRTSGEERYVVDPQIAVHWTDVSLVDDGAFFIGRSAEGEVLGFFHFATGRTDSLARLQGLANAYLSIAPDRRSAIFDRVERDESDLVLVRDL